MRLNTQTTIDTLTRDTQLQQVATLDYRSVVPESVLSNTLNKIMEMKTGESLFGNVSELHAQLAAMKYLYPELIELYLADMSAEMVYAHEVQEKFNDVNIEVINTPMMLFLIAMHLLMPDDPRFLLADRWFDIIMNEIMENDILSPDNVLAYCYILKVMFPAKFSQQLLSEQAVNKICIYAVNEFKYGRNNVGRLNVVPMAMMVLPEVIRGALAPHNPIETSLERMQYYTDEHWFIAYWSMLLTAVLAANPGSGIQNDGTMKLTSQFKQETQPLNSVLMY